MTVQDGRTRSRLAAFERWAREPDRTAATAPMRAAYQARFIAAARLLHPKGDEQLIAAVAADLRSIAAIRAARARWAKKGADK